METPIIDPDTPSTNYIFHRLFLVRTTEEALRTEKQVETYGVPSTGLAVFDNQLFNMATRCYIPISRMADIFDKGHMVSLVNHSDAKIVYEYIQYHLESWMKIISGGLNAVKAPYEDLKLLDRFATAVYGVAAHQYGGGAGALTPFGRFMAQFHHLSEDAFSLDKVQEAASPAVKPRVNLQDALLEHQARLLG